MFLFHKLTLAGRVVAGSSCDQDSLLYRYGDTDSGLGRATPPRRAPSPGQHPPSPSGPGSLPAHRRRYDDAASESGGSEYSGPRLYKQPATKSNKVFPRHVLYSIHRLYEYMGQVCFLSSFGLEVDKFGMFNISQFVWNNRPVQCSRQKLF